MFKFNIIALLFAILLGVFPSTGIANAMPSNLPAYDAGRPESSEWEFVGRVENRMNGFSTPATLVGDGAALIATPKEVEDINLMMSSNPDASDLYMKFAYRLKFFVAGNPVYRDILEVHRVGDLYSLVKFAPVELYPAQTWDEKKFNFPPFTLGTPVTVGVPTVKKGVVNRINLFDFEIGEGDILTPEEAGAPVLTDDGHIIGFYTGFLGVITPSQLISEDIRNKLR